MSRLKTLEVKYEQPLTLGRIVGGVLWLWGWILSHGGLAWLAFFVPVYAWYVAVMHVLERWSIT